MYFRLSSDSARVEDVRSKRAGTNDPAVHDRSGESEPVDSRLPPTEYGASLTPLGGWEMRGRQMMTTSCRYCWLRGFEQRPLGYENRQAGDTLWARN